MKPILMLAVAGAALVQIATTAQTAHAEAKTDRIRIEYVQPRTGATRDIYNKLKERQLLEKVRDFLAPVRLPHTLLFKTRDCTDANAWYDSKKKEIVICYQYIQEVKGLAPRRKTADDVTPDSALEGAIVDTVLHEFAHAIFDMLDLPVMGQEEDAADQMAAYVQLQLGKDEAVRLIRGTAHTYLAEAKNGLKTGKRASRKKQLQSFADEHGTPAQRYYNLVCIAYGADKKLFGHFVKKELLPKDRAGLCKDEYDQAGLAFEKLIWPHVDHERAKTVLDRSWLRAPEKKVKGRPPRESD
jgi:hypothetical protein